MEEIVTSELSTMPGYEINHFARWLAKATEAYFKDPDVKRRFEEWKKEREKSQQRMEIFP